VWDDDRMKAFRFERVSIVPQYAMSALNPTRKVGAIAEDLLSARGVEFAAILPELERRLDLVDLSHAVLGMYPIELSGGMKQRTVMVLSTLLDPSLLIADEVTSALDVASQRAVSSMLVEFRDRGFVKSTIVVTHDIAILYQIADTILIMYAGRLAEKAPAETIVARPRHPYTELLVGSLPEVGVRYEQKRLKGLAGSPPSLLDPPGGCRFRDRCPLATARCAQQPPFRQVAPGHHVACWER
jgi:peptide/nickel transport system ATP-binding protein